MALYRFAGQEFYFPYPIPVLGSFEILNTEVDVAISLIPYSFHEKEWRTNTEGWVGGAQRVVEVGNTPSGFFLKVSGGGEFFVTPHGQSVGKKNDQEKLTQLDLEIILGPVLVLALAMRGVWSLHASAVMYKESVIIFLGDSGQGKSTLATYLSECDGWRLVADDILPAKIDSNGVSVLPHFPQLKLAMDAQPGVGLPEHIPLKYICLLTYAESSQMPELQEISTAQTVQSLLSHIAGTRMFDSSLLTKHLDFSVQAGKQVSAYRLIHPHRRDTLPLVREFLEKIC